MIGSTKDGARSRRRTRAVLTTAAAIAAAGACAVPAQANLSAVGPTNPVTGVPDWYADALGNKLTLCLNDINCGPNSSLADFLAPDGSGEAFYWRGVSNDVAIGGGTVSAAFALEAAFPNGPGTPAQTFIRMRIRAKGVGAGTYRIDSPYGSFDIQSDGIKANLGPADVICAQATVNGPCNFASILGISPTGTDLGAFLHGTGMPTGYFGNGAGTSVVTGGSNVNTLTVTAPNGSKNSTDQWMITGKQFDPNAAPIAPLPRPAPVPVATGGDAVPVTQPAQRVLAVTAPSALVVSRLSLARRISVTRVRARGLRASMTVRDGTAVVRIAVYKARNGARAGRALFTTTRSPRSAGLFRVTLRSATLSKLKPGRYLMQVRAGRSAASLGSPTQIAFTITARRSGEPAVGRGTTTRRRSPGWPVQRSRLQATCLGTWPRSVKTRRIALWPGSAAGSNVHGQPPSITVMPCSRPYRVAVSDTLAVPEGAVHPHVVDPEVGAFADRLLGGLGSGRDHHCVHAAGDRPEVVVRGVALALVGVGADREDLIPAFAQALVDDRGKAAAAARAARTSGPGSTCSPGSTSACSSKSAHCSA